MFINVVNIWHQFRAILVCLHLSTWYLFWCSEHAFGDMWVIQLLGIQTVKVGWHADFKSAIIWLLVHNQFAKVVTICNRKPDIENIYLNTIYSSWQETMWVWSNPRWTTCAGTMPHNCPTQSPIPQTCNILSHPERCSNPAKMKIH